MATRSSSLTMPSDDSSAVDRLLRATPATAKVATALAAAEIGKKAFDRARSFARDRLIFSIQVRQGDPLFDLALEWVTELTPAASRRSLLAMSKAFTQDMSSVAEGSEQLAQGVRLVRSDDATQHVVVDGHRVEVSLSTDDEPGNSNVRREKKLILRAWSKAGQTAVVRKLESLERVRTTKQPSLYMIGSWGDWQKRPDLPPRSLDSVILPHEQKQSLVDDFQHFLDQESRYAALGIPWHRGYMFHGPPGTGKTSLARALTSHLGLDLWYVSLTDLKDGVSLASLLSGVRTRSVLLLEDIDTATITHDRIDSEGSEPGAISLGSLLNVLDGVATPHGLIVIMTTNDLDAIDPALRRAGRMDRIELVKPPGLAEVAEMYSRFYAPSFIDHRVLKRIEPYLGSFTQADVAEAFKRAIDSPELGLIELERTILTNADSERGLHLAVDRV